jgi:ABC-type uncharacterized transport system substrate-binding protein
LIYLGDWHSGPRWATGWLQKRLELLKDMTKALSRVAVLGNPTNPMHVPYLREAERAAATLGFELRVFEVRAPADLPGAFAAMVDWRTAGRCSVEH